MELTIEQVREWLTQNKETDGVKDFLSELSTEKPLTPEAFQKYLESADGDKLIQPLIDKRVTDAVKTRDRVNEEKLESELKKRLAVELLKINPQETPEQKQIRELREEMDKEKKLREKDLLKRQIVEAAAAVGLDPFFVDSYLPESLEEAQLYIKKIQERDKKRDEKLANELVSSSSFKPKSGEDNKKKVDLSKLSVKEMQKLEESGELDALLASQ